VAVQKVYQLSHLHLISNPPRWCCLKDIDYNPPGLIFWKSYMQQDNYGDIQIYWLDIARFVMGGTKTKKTWHAIICAQQKSMDWTRIGRNRRWSDIDKNILQKTCGESGESETNLGGAPLCADHGGRPADLKGGESIDSAWWAEDVKLLNEAPSYSFRRAKRWLQIGDDDNNVAVDRFGFLPIAKLWFLVHWV
jgi:hypothetical protein